MRAILPALVSVLVVTTGCGAAAGDGPERASVVFADNCGKCHGVDGHGKKEIAAPGIAGLPDWYVEAQLVKFRDGIRGAHGSDIEGLRMRPMSRTVSRSEFPALAQYVASLPPAPEESERMGKADAGKSYYAACAACHGPEGKGNKAMNAPPIGMLQSWYVETQLKKFRGGVRGAHPDDKTGQQMAPMAKTIPSDEAVTDLSAYVSSL
ncbi:MAG: c-type cytochrome [Alphaproteobacteria bacterium]|nr:c-type cytochrome [Alphaproteobacteria bacterium]MCB9693364.1 c-type cytochrome [Alphaproteobacteria bacterium]